MRRSKWLLFAVCACLIAGAAAPLHAQTLVFEGARLITGDGAAPIENSTFVVDGDRFTAIGRRGELHDSRRRRRVDSHRTLSIPRPALVDAMRYTGHGKGSASGSENYTRDTVRYAQPLRLFQHRRDFQPRTARGDLTYRLRAKCCGGRALSARGGRGFGMPDCRSGGPMRRLAYSRHHRGAGALRRAGAPANHVDLIEDLGRRSQTAPLRELRPDLYRAIDPRGSQAQHSSSRAHVDLADVKDLLRAGVDGFAHMIRDRDVDDELLALLKARPNVFFEQTLWASGARSTISKPAWLADPVLREAFAPREIDLLGEEFRSDPETHAPRAHERWTDKPEEYRAPRTRRASRWRSAPILGRDRRAVFRSRNAYRARASGDQGRLDADAGSRRRDQHLRAHSRARSARTVAPGKSADFSFSTPTRWTTSPTRAGSTVSTCAGRNFRAPPCGRDGAVRAGRAPQDSISVRPCATGWTSVPSGNAMIFNWPISFLVAETAISNPTIVKRLPLAVPGL